MKKLKPDQIGFCSWSMRPKKAQDLVDTAQALGVKKIQLALVRHMDDPGSWGNAKAMFDAAGIAIVSGMFGTVGEDYSTLQSIRETGGFDPDQHWEANLQIVKDVIPLARSLKLKLISCHAGFLPHDPKDRQFAKLVDRITTVAGEFHKAGMTVLFETGQENADTLLQFIQALERNGVTNAAVNFDPANIILYGMGDPIQALKKLLPRVKQVHIKDAIPTDVPGTWGREVPVGTGKVDWPAFLKTLSDGDFTGDLIIEREAGDDRRVDAKKAVDLLKKLMGS